MTNVNLLGNFCTKLPMLQSLLDEIAKDSTFCLANIKIQIPHHTQEKPLRRVTLILEMRFYSLTYSLMHMS